VEVLTGHKWMKAVESVSVFWMKKMKMNNWMTPTKAEDFAKNNQPMRGKNGLGWTL
jgi:hypothetical protein